jgi:hypothetical protein
MGEAKRRGDLESRIAEARLKRIAAYRAMSYRARITLRIQEFAAYVIATITGKYR